jgi:hypothetical protein
MSSTCFFATDLAARSFCKHRHNARCNQLCRVPHLGAERPARLPVFRFLGPAKSDRAVAQVTAPTARMRHFLSGSGRSLPALSFPSTQALGCLGLPLSESKKGRRGEVRSRTSRKRCEILQRQNSHPPAPSHSSAEAEEASAATKTNRTEPIGFPSRDACPRQMAHPAC